MAEHGLSLLRARDKKRAMVIMKSEASTHKIQVQIENKGKKWKSRGDIFCGIKISLYFAELYEVFKGTKPQNYGAP